MNNILRSPLYICPHPSCTASPPLEADAKGLLCAAGHFHPYLAGTNIPVFAAQEEGANEYSIEDAAAMHDNALRWLFNTFKTDENSLRSNLLAKLNLCKGQRVLITGAGAGNDIPHMLPLLQGEGEIYAQDIAAPMLAAAAERYAPAAKEQGIALYFNVSDAARLPFPDNFFDAAYHFGGINLFPDIRAGFTEMDRVVRQGGKVVIGDEGVAPWLKDSHYARMLTHNNYLYGYNAPIECVPSKARDVRLSWELSNTFWVIDFTAWDEDLPFDMDVPHVGTRGGSIRKRFFGQLEGVDPALKEALYAKAKTEGKSRVELLEKLLRQSIENK